MSPTEHIHGPHFSVGLVSDQTATREAKAHASGIGPLMIRGADCLTAALVACTADAGLNEARYRVLSALSGIRTGECSQSELAGLLLQSESNLSTLLERMSGDGLIMRNRSISDRRRSLIQMTPAGRDALDRAEAARSTAIAHLMRDFPSEQAEHLAHGLQRLVGELERSLDSGIRRATGLDPTYTSATAPRSVATSTL